MFHELKILICGAFLVLPCRGRYYSNDYYLDRYNNWWGSDGSGYQNELQCARVYDQPNYQGRSADFKDQDKDLNWGWYNSEFKPQSVKVKRGCGLTLFDYYGTKKSFKEDEQWTWGWGYPVFSACCECGGCEEPSVFKDVQCARLYEHEGCNGCDGFRLDMKNGDKVKSFGILDNLMASIAIRPGCQLTTFTKEHFQGFRYNFTNSIDLFGDNWRHQISSADCNCPYDPYPTWPPVTLPTVRPTWPSITTRPTWPSIAPTYLPPIWPTYGTTYRPRPPITLPTVPGNRPTWPIITLPTTFPTFPPSTVTIPTVTTTFPTFPPSTVTIPTVPTKTTTTSPPTFPTRPPTERIVIFQGPKASEEDEIKNLEYELSKEIDTEEDSDDESEEEDDNWEPDNLPEEEEEPWEEPTTTVKPTTTTTTLKPTTRKTTTTTETPEEENEDDFLDGFEDF